MVCGIVVTLAQDFQMSCNLLLALYMISVAKEFTALLLEDGFCVRFYG
jgi:hypothetical protein